MSDFPGTAYRSHDSLFYYCHGPERSKLALIFGPGEKTDSHSRNSIRQSSYVRDGEVQAPAPPRERIHGGDQPYAD